MGNLTLEESLSSILKATMRSMSLESFGDFFVLLPQEKKQELDDLVKKKLESGDLFENESEFWQRTASFKRHRRHHNNTKAVDRSRRFGRRKSSFQRTGK